MRLRVFAKSEKPVIFRECFGKVPNPYFSRVFWESEAREQGIPGGAEVSRGLPLKEFFTYGSIKAKKGGQESKEGGPPIKNPERGGVPIKNPRRVGSPRKITMQNALWNIFFLLYEVMMSSTVQDKTTSIVFASTSARWYLHCAPKPFDKAT